jgi:hypothetical protein
MQIRRMLRIRMTNAVTWTVLLSSQQGGGGVEDHIAAAAVVAVVVASQPPWPRTVAAVTVTATVTATVTLLWWSSRETHDKLKHDDFDGPVHPHLCSRPQ